MTNASWKSLELVNFAACQYTLPSDECQALDSNWGSSGATPAGFPGSRPGSGHTQATTPSTHATSRTAARSQGLGLRAEIGFQRAALAAAARQLTEIPPIAVPATPQRADRALDRTPSRERAPMSRRAPARDPRGFGLDL